MRTRMEHSSVDSSITPMSWNLYVWNSISINIINSHKLIITHSPLKTNNDLQNTTQKTKYQVTHSPLKTNNDLQNTTQKTKYQVTHSPLCLFFVDYVLPDI
jgi:hypothetical protein